MKSLNLFAVVAFVLASNAAQAAVCTDADETIKVRATSSVLVLSDPSVAAGRKTIARFTVENGTLDVSEDKYDNSAVYTATVDLRFNDSARAGEYLLGTRLGEIKTIEVLAGSDHADDYIQITKRNGQTKTVSLMCE